MHHLLKTGMKSQDASSASIENIVTFDLCYFPFYCFYTLVVQEEIISPPLYSLLVPGSMHVIVALNLLLHLLELLKTF